MGQAGRNAKVEVGARTPGVLTLVLRFPAYATGAPRLRMTKYWNWKKPVQSQDPFVLQIRKEISVYVLAGGGRGGGGR